MKTVNIPSVPKAARDFARNFEKEKFRLVRSLTQFEKFARQEFEELEDLKSGDISAEKGRRVGYWFIDHGWGVICTQANFKKFIKICEDAGEEESTNKTPAKATRKKSGAGRPKKTKTETTKTTKGKSRKSKTVKEPVLELDFDEDFSIEQNAQAFKEGFKQMQKHYKLKRGDVNALLEKSSESENIRELFELSFKYLGLV